MIVTEQRLRRFCSSGAPDIIQAIVDNWDVAEAAGINTPRRIQHFLATIAVETAGMTDLDENLNYRAKRLVEVWPKRFPTIEKAQPYANNPEKLANFVYANRLGNGNSASGDGWRFRGGGMIQTTGRENYRACGYEDNPEDLREPDGGFLAAVDYWTDHGLNRIADSNNPTAVRKAVNGGTNGLVEYKGYLAKARSIFTQADQSAALGLMSPSIAEASTVQEIEQIAANPEADAKSLKAAGSGIAQIADTDRKIAGAGAGVLGGGGLIGFVLDRYNDTKEYLAPVIGTFEKIPGSVYFLVIVALLGYMWWRSRTVLEKRVDMERKGESLTLLKAKEAQAPPE
jgi:putative chitinase